MRGTSAQMPSRWLCKKTFLDKYQIYNVEGEDITRVNEEAEARIIACAPEMYWALYNLVYELKRGHGSNVEYIAQVIPQIEELLQRVTYVEEKLKPCPFCGCGAEIYSDNREGYYVGCTGCSVMMRYTGTGAEYDSEANAISAWNKRLKHEGKNY